MATQRNPYAGWGMAAAGAVGSRLANKRIDQYITGPLDRWIDGMMTPEPVTASYANPAMGQMTVAPQVASPMSPAVYNGEIAPAMMEAAPVVPEAAMVAEPMVSMAAPLSAAPVGEAAIMAGAPQGMMMGAAPMAAEMGTVVGGALPAAVATEGAALAAPLAGVGAAGLETAALANSWNPIGWGIGGGMLLNEITGGKLFGKRLFG